MRRVGEKDSGGCHYLGRGKQILKESTVLRFDFEMESERPLTPAISCMSFSFFKLSF